MTTELTGYEQKILDNVEEFGCHITTVFDPDQQGPSYSYSAGFTKAFDQGEVIIFGLDADLMARMINMLANQCDEGLVLDEGCRVDGLLEGFEVVARSIPKQRIDREHFNSAMWFHHRTFGTELTRAFQIVWPGALDGLFPWEAGSDPLVCSSQPPLYVFETLQ